MIFQYKQALVADSLAGEALELQFQLHKPCPEPAYIQPMLYQKFFKCREQNRIALCLV